MVSRLYVKNPAAYSRIIAWKGGVSFLTTDKLEIFIIMMRKHTCKYTEEVQTKVHGVSLLYRNPIEV